MAVSPIGYDFQCPNSYLEMYSSYPNSWSDFDQQCFEEALSYPNANAQSSRKAKSKLAFQGNCAKSSIAAQGKAKRKRSNALIKWALFIATLITLRAALKRGAGIGYLARIKDGLLKMGRSGIAYLKKFGKQCKILFGKLTTRCSAFLNSLRK